MIGPDEGPDGCISAMKRTCFVQVPQTTGPIQIFGWINENPLEAFVTATSGKFSHSIRLRLAELTYLSASTLNENYSLISGSKNKVRGIIIARRNNFFVNYWWFCQLQGKHLSAFSSPGKFQILENGPVLLTESSFSSTHESCGRKTRNRNFTWGCCRVKNGEP